MQDLFTHLLTADSISTINNPMHQICTQLNNKWPRHMSTGLFAVAYGPTSQFLFSRDCFSI